MKKFICIFLSLILLFISIFYTFADVCYLTSKTGSYVTEFNIPSDFKTQFFYRVEESSCGNPTNIYPTYLVTINGYDYLYLNEYYYYFGFQSDSFTGLTAFGFSEPLKYEGLKLEVETAYSLFFDTYDNGILHGSKGAYDLGFYTLLGIDIVIVDSDYYATSNFSICPFTDLDIEPLPFLLDNLFTFASFQIDIWRIGILFIMSESNRIILLSVVAWLFVIGVGSIRKFVTGVQ